MQSRITIPEAVPTLAAYDDRGREVVWHCEASLAILAAIAECRTTLAKLMGTEAGAATAPAFLVVSDLMAGLEEQAKALDTMARIEAMTPQWGPSPFKKMPDALAGYPFLKSNEVKCDLNQTPATQTYILGDLDQWNRSLADLAAQIIDTNFFAETTP